MQLWESLIFGLWPRKLLIFEDRVEMIDDGPIQSACVSWPYARVQRVRALKGSWFVNLVIEGTEGTLFVRGVETKDALRAKELVEERI